MTSVLFVCMGNICRSPTAEGFFRQHLAGSELAASIRTDSAGTHGYHVGHPPDERALATARRWGVDLSDLRARRVGPEDFQRFDLVLAMDEANHEILQRLNRQAGQGADLRLMMEFSPRFADIREVPDPYYGGQDGFDFMCELLDEATRGLLAELESGGIGARGRG